MSKKEAVAWARARELDIKGRPGWQVEISLVTSGELPPSISTGREPEFWVQISDAGYWMVLRYPLAGLRRVQRKADYVSWHNPKLGGTSASRRLGL